MPQISKRKLPPDTHSKIWSQLVLAFKGFNKGAEIELLLNGLLTETEQFMIGKRLMAQVLLVSGWTQYQIAELLKLNHSTVYKWSVELKLRNDYQQLLKKKYPKIKFNKNTYKKPNFVEEVFNTIMNSYRDRSKEDNK